MITREELSPFQRGYIAGLAAYAWWKDGTEFVGTTGSTLNKAVVRFLAEQGISITEADVRHLR